VHARAHHDAPLLPKQADEVTHGLLRLQAQLDEGVALTERYAGVLRQRFVIGSDPSDAPADPDAPLSAPRAFEVHNRQLARQLEASAQQVRTSYRQLLLHCSLLLDGERTVQRAEGHLRELDELVRAGKAVEVTFLWKQQAHVALRRALIGLSLRLELHVRALLAQREGSGSMLGLAEQVRLVNCL